jgi:hypothetical protein
VRRVCDAHDLVGAHWLHIVQVGQELQVSRDVEVRAMLRTWFAHPECSVHFIPSDLGNVVRGCLGKLGAVR